jgi:hypothetical protein
LTTRVEAVLRALKGEDISVISNDLAVSVGALEHWRDEFIAAGGAAIANGDPTSSVSIPETLVLECFSLGGMSQGLTPASPRRRWMDIFPDRHAYRCLPMVIANSYGWDLLSPCAFAVDWNGRPDKSDIAFRVLDGFPYLTNFAHSNFSNGIVTLTTGYLFRTPTGWDLMATPPHNNPKDGIVGLTGLMETDWLPYPFTMNWQLTRPGTVCFEKDEPFCTVFPVEHGVLEKFIPHIRNITDTPDLHRQFGAWRAEREIFLERLNEGDPDALRQAWQKYYFHGELTEITPKAPSHVRKLHLADPIDRRV